MGGKAEGIPDRDRYGDPKKIPLRQLLTYVDQLHKAERAGGIEYEGGGRVGTGFDDAFRRWLWENQDAIKGRVARITSTKKLPSGKYYQPSFVALHEDYPSKTAEHTLVHYSRDKYPELRPLSYEELTKDRAQGRWEKDPAAVKQYIAERKRFENVLRKRLAARGINYNPDSSFLYSTIDGYEQFGKPGRYRHQAKLSDKVLNNSFFDVVGDGRKRLVYGKRGLMEALKRYQAAEQAGKLNSSEYMGMNIRPRVEVVTAGGYRPETVKRAQALHEDYPTKQAEMVVTHNIHGDEPAGEHAAKKLQNVERVDAGNHTGKRRFHGKDLNRHFGTSSSTKQNNKILNEVLSKKPSLLVDLHEDSDADGAYAYTTPEMKDRVKAILKKMRDKLPTANTASGDKTDEGVITDGKYPGKGALVTAAKERGVPYVLLETPSKEVPLNSRIRYQQEFVKTLKHVTAFK